MTALAEQSPTNQLRTAEEGRVFVLDASRHCPSPEQCDIHDGETYEAYVHRHCREHGIVATLPRLEDYERNLTLWCFYYGHKYTLENDLLTPFPFWEDHEFLSNWDWNEDDLEMNTPKAERVNRIPPLASRRPGDVRRQKKLEKPRETLKTTEGFAIMTLEHLRAYYLEDKVTFRVTVISSTRRLTKNRYVLAAQKVWGAKKGKLFDLFYGWETFGPEGKKERRKIGLIHSRGGVDLTECAVTLRWLADSPSSFATHSVIGFGADSQSTGERSDFTIADDVCTKDNSDKLEKRQKIKGVLAEQEKQLEHGGYMVWFDTRKHLDDASGEIDKFPTRLYWHILHRKSYWTGADGEIVYYWPIDGRGKPRIDEAWLEEQRAKHGERDFWNELMNEPQDPDKALFRREFFPIISPSNAPAEVTAGLGVGNAPGEEMLAYFERETIRIRAYNGCDPAGREKALKRGDDSAILGVRLDRFSNIWIVYMASGKWPDSQRKEEIWACQQYNRATVFLYEATFDSGVEAGFQNFQMEKSKEIDSPVLIPLRIVKPTTITTKAQKIEGHIEPFARRGAIRILSNAGSEHEIEKFIAQHTGFLIEDHDDYPDVLATIIKEIGVIPRREQKAPPRDDVIESVENGILLPIGAAMKKMTRPDVTRWGRASGRAD